MKEITAYIGKHKLGAVIRTLHKVDGLTGISILDCRGYGRGLVTAADPESEFHPRVKLELICHDELIDLVVSAIEKAAHTGLKGDGKIYVSPIENAVRISTGERGEGAV
ncbi:MAG: nitrogen regulatory protein P-II [Desulfobulbaceae bacterium BRH_c16a]|nr:MAG: nitrogen regulatory protein P-II [Desulfobulbaceae bacterium BRH_c16a]